MPSWLNEAINHSTIIRELRERVDYLTKELNGANLRAVEDHEIYAERIAQRLTRINELTTEKLALSDELARVRRDLGVSNNAILVLDERRAKADLAAKRLAEQIEETTAALEEANARIATLESELRIARGGEQIPLAGAPAETEEEPAPPAEDKVVNDITAVFVTVIRGLFFEGRHHWALGHGEQRVTAPINDKAFLDRMNKREVFFAAGDALRARMRLITYQKPAGDMYVKYSVEEVLSILPPDEQQSLIPAPAAAAIATEGARP